MNTQLIAAAFLAAVSLPTALNAQAESLLRSGDPIRGKAVYGRCKACHALDRDRTGPRHCGLFGRSAGSIDGFRYSEAMRNSGVIWTPETLDVFLKDSRSFIPKNRMGYAGIRDPRDRADLIAYLQQENRNPAVCR